MYALSSILVISLRRREPARPRSFRVFGYPLVPALVALLFLGLGIEALLTPTGPSGFPGALIFFLAIVTVMSGYVVGVVPRLKKRRSARRMASTPR
jgi:amino acid transporter